MRTGSSVAVRPPEAVRVGRGGHVANSNRGNGAMDLRRRGKNRVVEAMARIVALLPKGEEPARPNCDVDVDWWILSQEVLMSPSSHACNASARFASRWRILSMTASISTREAAERNKGSS
jgi:hypothetical protein